MFLGCIGDDFTGSTDLANTLNKAGFSTVQYNGIPENPAQADVEAGVVALKTRTLPVAEAIEKSLRALRWLRAQGCEQFYFKYCSTFDSTREGNIGPVLDALMAELEAERALVCPAFPANGRTVYQGHLFVFDRLLNESGMQNHPLTPMVDADIRRWLGYQTRHRVGHVGIDKVKAGIEAVRQELDELSRDNARHIVVDTIDEVDLLTLGRAAKGELLISGGSGLGMGLGANFPLQSTSDNSVGFGWSNRGVVILAGSCSARTREQIAAHIETNPSWYLEAEPVLSGKVSADMLASWAIENSENPDNIPLIYSSAPPETVAAYQAQFGGNIVAQAFEELLAATARALVEKGLTRLVTAGGETSGAIVSALDASGFEIGPEISPGVPAVKVVGKQLALALKSGNFGEIDFFAKAAAAVRGETK